MAGPKLKQYLENSWYRGASQDRQTGYAAQFQYGENVNIRDIKNGVCLSGGSTDILTHNKAFTCYKQSNNMYIADVNGKVHYYDSTGTEVDSWDLGVTSVYPPIILEFGYYTYVILEGGIFALSSGGTSLDVTPAGFGGGATCALNYANTFLLVSDFNRVWRLSKEGSVVINNSKVIRDFEWGNVCGLTQEGNYLKIYVSDGADTKVHYAKGTFDVEETGLIQTVSFNGLATQPLCVSSDQGQDYVAFIPTGGEIKLAKVSGYNKTDIRWTQTWDGQKIFGGTPRVMASDGVLFVATDEGIWTFTEYNGWLWGGCLEFKEDYEVMSLYRYGETLYACLKVSSSSYILRSYDLSFHPAKYQSHGFIIGRVFDGGCAGLFKKNDQATITYNMPVGTSMELSYRYDRSSFGYDKTNFISIKKLTDINNCYDIVVPTTPGVKDESVLLKEDGDKILLENGNGIGLEDTLVCPFNRTWNLLEYRFDLDTTDTTKTPTLYEHSLTYYDYMRKYR